MQNRIFNSFTEKTHLKAPKHEHWLKIVSTKWRSLVVFISLSAILPSLYSFEPTPEIRFTFVHINDSHGHFYPRKSKKETIYGSLALHAHLIQIREEAQKNDAKVIVTHGGDMNTGTPESSALQAEPDINLMNLMGFSVAVLGNHEFDVAPDVLKRQIKMSSFPWISANIYKSDGSLLVPSHISLEHHEINVAILGLTTDSTVKIGNREHIKGLKFTEPVAEARTRIAQLKKNHDVVVALTHLGHYPDENKQQREYAGEIALAKNTSGLDLILGGHSHTLVKNDVVNGVPIFQAECYKKYAIRVDVGIQKGGKAKVLSHEVIDLSKFPKGFEERRKKIGDETIQNFMQSERVIANALMKTETLFSKKVGYAEDSFLHERRHLFRRSTALGNLVADAQRKAVNADFAIVNAGGIRAGLKGGDITVRDILTVSPFANTIGIVKMSGRELTEMFQELLSRKPDGHFPHISGGVILFNQDVPRTRVFIGRELVKPNQIYKVAFNNFTAAGGNSYPNFAQQNRFADSGITDADALRDYLLRKKTVSPQQFKYDRIRFFKLKNRR